MAQRICGFRSIVLALFIACQIAASRAFAQTIPTTQQAQNSILTSADVQNQRLAFEAANAGNRAQTELHIRALDNKALIPFIERDLLLHETSPSRQNLTNWLSTNPQIQDADKVYDRAKSLGINDVTSPQIPNNRRSFTRFRIPRDKSDAHGPNANEAARAALNRTIQLFGANDDEAALDTIQSQLDGAFAGRAAWFGGLSAYRAGYFEIARNLFQISANWQYGDDNSRAAGAFWAARAATKLQLNEEARAFLEQAATNPYSFYGQLALMRLGRWQNLSIPTIQSENSRAIELVKSNPRVKNALLLKEIGQIRDAQAELLSGWNAANSDDDLGFIAIAQIMVLPQIVTLIRENSDSAEIAAAFPIIDNIAPQGGSFVLDRALIFAIMRQESRFNQNAVSYAGARGLMQLMPATAAWMTGRPELRQNPALLHDVSLNLLLGEGYIERVMAMPIADNNIARTLMSYNAGPGNISSWARRIEMSEDTLFFIEATPVTQTREYVKHVLTNLWIYHARLGQNAPTLEKLAFNRVPQYEPQDNPRQLR
ncbi:MAG: slt [Hyphomonadaceae bacterium]|nr:MAG: slt [Hyphomonadaceae bacterium]KAF0186036.1 MAG: slt [Hyphomonadaceae bacterium]